MAGAMSFREGLLSVTAIVLLGSLPCFSQNPPPAQGPPSQGGAPSAEPSGGRSRQPGAETPQPQQLPDMPRPVYLSGNVRLPDGSPPPASVVIEIVCGSVVRPEAYTDSNGRFSFIVANGNSSVFLDASVAGDSRSVVPGRQRSPERDLSGCEIRANLAGFISQSIVFGFRQSMKNPNIGAILIRPLENVRGYTFSITTALASKDARKAYEEGIQDAKKQKWSDAEREFAKSVKTYPKYAVAWFELG